MSIWTNEAPAAHRRSSKTQIAILRFASPALQARLREIGDEAAEGLAIELAGTEPDGVARLVAGMIVLTWRTAHAEAIRVFERGGSAKKASAAFLALIDRGFAAARAASNGPRG